MPDIQTTEQPLENLSFEDLKLRQVQMQVQLDRAQQVLDERSDQEVYGEHVKKVRDPVMRVLEQCGLSETGAKAVVKSMGSYRAFQLDEYGSVVTDIGGVLRPIAEALPVHPLVQAMIAGGGIGVHDGRRRLEIEIRDAEANVARLRAEAERSPQENGPGIRYRHGRQALDALKQRLAEMTTPVAAPVKRPVDPQLLIRRGELKRQITALEERVRESRGSNTYLVELAPVRSQLRDVEAAIAQQQNG